MHACNVFVSQRLDDNLWYENVKKPEWNDYTSTRWIYRYIPNLLISFISQLDCLFELQLSEWIRAHKLKRSWRRSFVGNQTSKMDSESVFADIMFIYTTTPLTFKPNLTYVICWPPPWFQTWGIWFSRTVLGKFVTLIYTVSYKD